MKKLFFLLILGLILPIFVFAQCGERIANITSASPISSEPVIFNVNWDMTEIPVSELCYIEFFFTTDPNWEETCEGHYFSPGEDYFPCEEIGSYSLTVETNHNLSFYQEFSNGLPLYTTIVGDDLIISNRVCLYDCPTEFSIIPINSGLIDNMLAYVGNLFTDISPIIILTIGLPLAFLIIIKIISIGRNEKKPTKETEKFWREMKKDDKEIEKINRMIDRKQAKEMDKWFQRWIKEGYFWRKEKSKKGDWL